TNLIKILGEGHLIQKQDVFSKKRYAQKHSKEYLQQKYDDHFQGREYTCLKTFLVITKRAKGRYNPKSVNDFVQVLGKVIDLFDRSGVRPEALSGIETDRYVKRILSMNFHEERIVLDNLLAEEEQVESGDRAFRSITLVDTDKVELPEKVTTHLERNDKDTLKGFPVDNMVFLFSVPNFQTIVYNQVLEIVEQRSTLTKLELKRKRHSGIPDPA